MILDYRNKWFDYEIEYLTENVNKLSATEISKGLYKLNKQHNNEVDRSFSAVKNKIKKLGLK